MFTLYRAAHAFHDAALRDKRRSISAKLDSSRLLADTGTQRKGRSQCGEHVMSILVVSLCPCLCVVITAALRERSQTDVVHVTCCYNPMHTFLGQ